MKILAVSDSHGNIGAIKTAVELEKPELILHMGDYESDCPPVMDAYPHIPVKSVRGNCDYRGVQPESELFELEGRRFFMTHGHIYGVKFGLADIVNNAMLRRADVLLFGHTHIPYYDEYEGLHIINPGSVGKGDRSYATIVLTADGVECEIKYL